MTKFISASVAVTLLALSYSAAFASPAPAPAPQNPPSVVRQTSAPHVVQSNSTGPTEGQMVPVPVALLQETLDYVSKQSVGSGASQVWSDWQTFISSVRQQQRTAPASVTPKK